MQGPGRRHDQDRTGTGDTFAITWDGTSGGSPVADGTYPVTVDAVDAWGNATATTSAGTLIVDTVAPDLTAVSPAADPVPWFSPNGDGLRETVAFSATTPEAGSLTMRVVDGADALVRKTTVRGQGRCRGHDLGRPGQRRRASSPTACTTIRVTLTDTAGNTGAAIARPVRVSTPSGS